MHLDLKVGSTVAINVARHDPDMAGGVILHLQFARLVIRRDAVRWCTVPIAAARRSERTGVDLDIFPVLLDF